MLVLYDDYFEFKKKLNNKLQLIWSKGLKSRSSIKNITTINVYQC